MTSKAKPGSAGRLATWDEKHRRLEVASSAIADLIEPDTERQQQILRERAVSLARMPARQEQPHPISAGIEVIKFMLAGERYAFETAHVAHVSALCPVTPLPGLPNFVVGITILQGEVLSVIDLRSLLNLPVSRLAEPTSMIVLKNQAMEFGILAEEILGIERLPEDSIERDVPTLANTASTYLKGISASRTAILNADQLLSDPRLVIEIS